MSIETLRNYFLKYEELNDLRYENFELLNEINSTTNFNQESVDIKNGFIELLREEPKNYNMDELTIYINIYLHIV